MSWNGQLSKGAIRAIFQEGNDVPSPVVQVLQIKKITGPAGEVTVPERYRVVISDGIHHHSFMLATQRNHLIADDILAKNSIVRLDEYNTNEVRGRKIMIVLRVEKLSDPRPPIGAPVGIEGTDPSPQESPVGSFPPTPHPAPTSAVSTSLQLQTAPISAPQQQHFSAPQQHQQQQQPFRPPMQSPAVSSSFGGGSSHRAPLGGPQASTASSVDDIITEDMVIPIKVLSPFRHRWAIKGRVTSKGPVRTWSNDRGSGKLFKVDLADATGGEISINCFNSAVDKFFPIFQEQQVYYVSRGVVKGANKRFSSGNSAYEITLDPSSIVQQAPDQADIPRVNWTTTMIAALKDHPLESPVTVIGVILELQDPVEIPSKQRPGETLSKRILVIGDRSRASIEISLWGSKVTELADVSVGSTVGFKNAKLGTYNTLSLSCSSNTHAELNPDTPVAHELLGWYRQGGCNMPFEPLTQNGSFKRGGAGSGSGGAAGGGERKGTVATCADVRLRSLGAGSTPDFFLLKGTVTTFRKDSTFYYRSCPTDKCNKKVSGELGQFHCEKCNMQFPTCSYRYILSFTTSDHTGQLLLTAFNDGAETLLGHSAAEVAGWKEASDWQACESAFDAASFKSYKFKCRAFTEEYNGEKRIKYSVQSLQPPDFIQDSAEMITRLRSLLPAQ